MFGVFGGGRPLGRRACVVVISNSGFVGGCLTGVLMGFAQPIGGGGVRVVAGRLVLARVVALQLGSSRSCCRRRGCVVSGMELCWFGKLLGMKASVVLRLRSATGSCLIRRSECVRRIFVC